MFKKRITTINFEGNEIRFLVTRGNKVKSWKSSTVPLEIMNQGLILHPATVSKVIQSTLKKLRAPKRNVVTSVTGQRSVHRIMRIPNIPDNLLDETIIRKVKQEFAIPIDETDISWRMIGRSKNEIVLYVLAIPNNIIDHLVISLRNAKIKPNQMDIKPLALQRVINQKTAIIVNLESYSLGVIIIVNHVPILVRSVPLETGGLTVEAKVDLLSQELARTIKYYNESNKNNRLPENTGVYISGKLFDLQRLEARLDETTNLSERLQTRTPYPVHLPKPPFPIPPQLPLGKYAVNLGLALKTRK